MNPLVPSSRPPLSCGLNHSFEIVWMPLCAVPVRKQGGSVQVQINVNAKAQFESKYWRGVLDAQGKVDGGYY